jgi:hypothetical protein
MKLKEYLQVICDEHGPLQTTAYETMQYLTEAGFNELVADMRTKLDNVEASKHLLKIKNDQL